MHWHFIQTFGLRLRVAPHCQGKLLSSEVTTNYHILPPIGFDTAHYFASHEPAISPLLDETLDAGNRERRTGIVERQRTGENSLHSHILATALEDTIVRTYDQTAQVRRSECPSSRSPSVRYDQ